MGDLFRPTIKEAKPTKLERSAQANAESERLKAVRDQAEARTAQMMRLFGSKSALGFSSGGI